MKTFTVDPARVATFADILQRLAYHPDDFQEMTPFRNDPFREVHFLFFLTAIDHRTHGKRRYEALVDGTTVHGSELLFHLAGKATATDPDLFTAQRMADVPEELLRDIFTTSDGRAPVNVPERTALLHDAARVLLSRYQGDLRNMFTMAGGFLRRQDGKGILDLMKEIRAYEDPVEKKSYLLVKVLRRRGLLELKDPEHLAAPIDHILFTIALRSGLISADGPARETIVAGSCLGAEMLKELRLETLQAFQEVAAESGITVDVFDDLLWKYGRECLRFPPRHLKESLESIKSSLDDRIGNKDALREFLFFINGLDPDAPEGASLYPVPKFPDTWYF